jgi:hypothetical protein
VIQFDQRIHVPEGSWLVWPWGFDTLLTSITWIFGPYASEAEANRVLMNIPPMAMPIAVGLVVTIARQLALPFLSAVLLVFGFAALPMVYMQFAVGNIDHHFAELLWTLGTMSAGIRFFRTGPTRVSAGIVLGAALGSAMAIHNGLFVLQIPIALSLGSFWLRGFALPPRPQLLAFCGTLLGTTLLVCIPSEPWRRGFFEFYTLSWFHFYIASCVAVFAALLGSLERRPRNIAALSIAAVLALLPIFGTLAFAGEFVSGQLEVIRNVTEVKSPYQLYADIGESMSTRLLSLLMWLTAPMLLLNLWWVYRSKDPLLQFVAMVGALGLALMQMQYRFCVFGVLPMLLTPLLAAQLLTAARPAWNRALQAGCVVLLALAMYPTLKNWQLSWTRGGDPAYARMTSIFPRLHELCEAHPGVVLGEINIGHWVRYHSKCSVIADVFLLTPQHARKVAEVTALMGLTPAQLLAAKNIVPIRYVFAHHVAPVVVYGNVESPDVEEIRQSLDPLERGLLGPEDAIPKEFKKRWEVRTPAGRVYARLYEIGREP